uniref:Uncharacterized protein n=1 Tax=Sphaerodactylus townsendi TaxID=933632 RepID=A0ACB8FXL5_9SAUR
MGDSKLQVEGHYYVKDGGYSQEDWEECGNAGDRVTCVGIGDCLLRGWTFHDSVDATCKVSVYVNIVMLTLPSLRRLEIQNIINIGY